MESLLSWRVYPRVSRRMDVIRVIIWDNYSVLGRQIVKGHGSHDKQHGQHGTSPELSGNDATGAPCNRANSKKGWLVGVEALSPLSRTSSRHDAVVVEPREGLAVQILKLTT